jgi:predicted lipoprotein with Yx(FWY)xxD motif
MIVRRISERFCFLLVDSKDMTLYLNTRDTPGTSNCSGSCANAWPPPLTTGAPSEGNIWPLTNRGTICAFF